ncbi:unnamed protein product [Absidia cylindrospora]
MSRRRTVRQSDDGEDPNVIWTLMKEKLVNQEYWTTNPRYHTYIAIIRPSSNHHPFSKKVLKELSRCAKNQINDDFWTKTAPSLQQSHIDRCKLEIQTEGAFLGINTTLLTKHARQLEEKNDQPHVLPSSSKKHKTSSFPGPSSLPESSELSPSPVSPSSLTRKSKLPVEPSTSVESSTSAESSISVEPSTSVESSTSAESSISVELSTSAESSTSVELPTLVEPSTSVKSAIPTTESPPLDPDLLVETDNILTDSSKLSIATIIKRKAIVLHDQYKHGNPLSSRQRKIMSNGLSSILDLVDQSYPSQRSLFLSLEWNQINHLFKSKYDISVVDLDPVLCSTWKIICGTVNESRNIKNGLLYLYRIFPKYQSSNLMPSLKALEHILDLLDQDAYLLQESALVPPGYDIRIKTGETCYPYTSKCKQDMYKNSSKVSGFKVDLRFIVEKDGQEYDICSVEAACNAQADTKVISDEGKLNREMKDQLDAMIEMMGNATTTATELCGWGIQIIGASCLIRSLHLADNGLYVAIHHFDITLPRSIPELQQFTTTMSQLLTFRQHLLKSVNFILLHAKSNNKQPDSFNSRDVTVVVDGKQRDTWYTPPENTESRLPMNLTGLSPLPSLKANLLSLACKDSLGAVNDKNNSEEDRDDFGWKYDGKIWCNMYTGERSENSPYEETG